MKSKKEVRVRIAPQKFQVRTSSDGSRTVGGKAVVYGALSEDLSGFREKIAPGAFSTSLRSADVLALYGHDVNNVIGRQSSGTLTLRDTPTALEFECNLPDTQVGRDVATLCARGDLRGMSFGFTVTDDTWQDDGTGQIIRTVNTAEIVEISVVSMPAYSQSTVSLRSCPVALRTKLTKRDDDDGDDESYRPECDETSDSYDAEAICDEDGDDLDEEDSTRADLLRVRQLFNSRHKILTNTTL